MVLTRAILQLKIPNPASLPVGDKSVARRRAGADLPSAPVPCIPRAHFTCNERWVSFLTISLTREERCMAQDAYHHLFEAPSAFFLSQSRLVTSASKWTMEPRDEATPFDHGMSGCVTNL